MRRIRSTLANAAASAASPEAERQQRGSDGASPADGVSASGSPCSSPSGSTLSSRRPSRAVNEEQLPDWAEAQLRAQPDPWSQSDWEEKRKSIPLQAGPPKPVSQTQAGAYLDPCLDPIEDAPAEAEAEPLHDRGPPVQPDAPEGEPAAAAPSEPEG